MKEPYEQGLANQFGLESCAGFREETGEALTEVNPGQPLSSEITSPGCRPRPTIGKASQATTLSSQSLPGPAESEILCMRRHSMFENRESSAASAAEVHIGSVGEGQWP